ncbi:hypothetical protein [Mameliella alba]|uniref:hypothetical protein n=1 Tax=Mameliella alba TaxID=561184 RepID=UPI001430E1C9|nr:hypothetical protein [Mameliella alba]
MTYQPKPAPHPTGQHRERMNKLREDAGLNEKGFRTDGTDPLKEEKEAMLKELHRRADARLSGLF